MASLRRAKNYASDAQTPMFLYTILKQLDLRSIDWNAVADKLDISNGHAARMRYSRMKSQFEGVAAQPRTPRPKKEKASSKSTMEVKGKGKRLLLEEEEERLTRENIFEEKSEIQYRAQKRIKENPALDLEAPLQHLVPNPYEQFMDPAWSIPMIKLEAPTTGISPTSISGQRCHSLVKLEPDRFSTEVSNLSSLIKEEPTSLLACQSSNATMTAGIKREHGTTSSPSNTENFYTNMRKTSLQASSNIDAGMRQPLFHLSRTPGSENLDASCIVTRSRPIAMGMPAFRHHRPIDDYFQLSESTPCPGPGYLFNPLATSFEDLLAMPLQDLREPDFGGMIPIRGTDTGSMNTGIQHSQSTDDMMACGDEESGPPDKIDDLDQLVDHSSSTHHAIETNVNAEDVDGEDKTDHTIEVKAPGATDSGKGNNPKYHAGVENVLIKQEIIEILD